MKEMTIRGFFIISSMPAAALWSTALSLSTSFGQDYKLNMAAHHTSGDAVKFYNITDTFFTCYLISVRKWGEFEVMSD